MVNKIIQKHYITFDDVLIKPGRSDIEPREASLHAVLCSSITLSVPFISAAMDRVTEVATAIAIYNAGGIGIIHRNCTIQRQVEMVKEVKKTGAKVGAACGPFDLERAIQLKKSGIDILCIDCAHGHNAKVIASTKNIKNKVGDTPIMIGNIASAEAVKDLVGIADIVKVGVGPGSICTTRIVSGIGVPQLSAIIEVSNMAHKYKMQVVADGGMRNSGDIAKALAAGADAVMLGNLFAGCDECPGKRVIKDSKAYKEYRGMGSHAVLAENKSSDRYLVDGRKSIPEGVEGLVVCTGSISDTVLTLVSGVQVSMGYVGARNLHEFYKKAQFIKISPATIVENKPHSLF